MELGYQKAEDSITQEGWRDNWFRTFRGMPKFSKAEKAMIAEFVNGYEYGKAVIYLTDDRFGYNFDSDMAEFIVREFIRGV